MKITKSINKAVRIVVLLLLMFTTNKVAWGQAIFTGSGNWTDAANWSSGIPNGPSVNVIINGTVIISSAITVGNITVNAGGTINVNASITTAGNITVNTNGVVNVNNSISLTTGTLVIVAGSPNGKFTLGNGAVLNLSGDFTNNGDFIAFPTSSVNFNGAGTANISGTTTFGNLSIDKANNTDLVAPPPAVQTNYTVNGNLTIIRGIFDVRKSVFTVNGVTTLNNGGTFTDTEGTSTTDFNSFKALNINSSGVFTTGSSGGNQFRFLGNIVNSGTFDIGVGSASSGWQLGDASTDITITNNSTTTMFFSRGLNGSGTILGNVTIANGTGTGNIELRGNGTPSGSGNITIANGKTLINNLGSNLAPTGKRLMASPRNGAGGTFVNNGIVEIQNAEGTSEPTYDFNATTNLVILNNITSVMATTYNDVAFIGSSNTLAGTASVKGNWRNNSTFTATSGTITFNGIAAQIIDGTSTTTFNNLIINNTFASNPTVTLNNSITVTSVLTLAAGKIVLAGASNLLIGNNGSIVSAAPNRYIVTSGTGALRKNVSSVSSFTFHVGGATYKPITLGSVNSVNGASVRFATGAPVPNSGVGSWFISNANGTTMTNSTIVVNSPGGLAPTAQIATYSPSTWAPLSTTFSSGDYSLDVLFGFPSTATVELAVFTPLASTDFYSIANGAYGSPATWSNFPTGTVPATSAPNVGANVFIRAGNNVTVVNTGEIWNNTTISIDNSSVLIFGVGASGDIINVLNASSGAKIIVNDGVLPTVTTNNFATTPGTTIEFSGGGYTIPVGYPSSPNPIPYQKVIISGTASKSTNNAQLTKILDNLTINYAVSSIGFALGNNSTLELGGSIITTNGIFAATPASPNTTTVVLNGTGTQNIPAVTFRTLIIDKTAGVATLVAGITVETDFTITQGTFSAGSASLTISGGFTNNGTFTANTSSVIFNGTTAQTIGGTPTTFITTFNNLTINRPSATGDVVMNHGITVAGTLALSGGKLVTGIYELQLTNANFATQLTGGNSSNYIVTSPNGKFSRNNVTNPSTAVLFPIGIATSYTPLNITNVGGSASVSVRDEATITVPATPFLSSLNKVKLIWNISTSNNASTVLFNWNLGDETGILTLALAKIHQLNANWIPIAATTITLTTPRNATATITQNGDFAVFEAIPTCPTLVFNNTTAPDATINTLYTFNAGVTVASGINYSITPTLPTGLSFNTTTGIISGTPTALSSANNYTVTATQVGCTGFSQLYNFGVVAAPIPLATPRTDIKFVPTPNKIVFSWLAVANATAYEVRKATTFKADGTFDWGTSRNVGNVIVLSDDIIYDVVTYYSVRAIGTVNSGWSTTVSIFISSVNDPATALNANINTQIILLPNPATDNFIIDNANANAVFKENNIAFTLMDMTGKTILIENTAQGLPYKMNLDKVAKGLYFVKITTKENAVIKKIVKE